MKLNHIFICNHHVNSFKGTEDNSDADAADSDGSVNEGLHQNSNPSEHGARSFRICSWLPNAADRKCRALPADGAQCCDNIAETIAPSAFASVDMGEGWGCRDYKVGGCNTFYGFDGVSPQAFDLTLHGCTGTLNYYTNALPAANSVHLCMLHLQKHARHQIDARDRSVASRTGLRLNSRSNYLHCSCCCTTVK